MVDITGFKVIWSHGSYITGFKVIGDLMVVITCFKVIWFKVVITGFKVIGGLRVFLTSFGSFISFLSDLSCLDVICR